MLLLITISLICFILSFFHIITKPIIALFGRPSSIERELLKEVKSLQQELSKLSQKDEYTAFVKLERKIIATNSRLMEVSKERKTKNVFIKYGIGYGGQTLLTIGLIYISMSYRSEPVIVMSDKFDFTPFNMLMRFPTGIKGAISVPFWIFVNSFVARGVASYFSA